MYMGNLFLDWGGLTELVRRLDDFEQVANRIGIEVVYERVPDVLSALSKVPGPPSSPFVWSHDPAANRRAQRWWFAAIKRGIVETDGEHYVRTGRTIQGWRVEAYLRDDTFVIRVSNRARDGLVIAFIYGSLSFRSLNEARRFQLPGHRDTGWPFAAEIVRAFYDEVEATWITRMGDYYGMEVAPEVRRRSRR